ncbi:hypothetical protein BDF21DRAFT_462374 [Thamnidium elegans]|uniref:Uncharacterized protein n=1 Tax=Thamnidium elegans TaxID=101142 RepID=A0A8H7SJ66_9FUNG|nr:hypothetical protein INT48_009180 [Thamnidium elegans]KAI8082304.1 hypothetical protein BDF21DRAFT_462374 [Thamnidium elegans]
MKSDVVYAPMNSRDKPLPPILVEVQHTVDLKLYLRVNEYCLQMIKKTSCSSYCSHLLYQQYNSRCSTQDLIYTPENENENWAYIDSVRKHYDDKIDWEACFQVGKILASLPPTNFKNVKSCYFRANSSIK